MKINNLNIKINKLPDYTPKIINVLHDDVDYLDGIEFEKMKTDLKVLKYLFALVNDKLNKSLRNEKLWKSKYEKAMTALDDSPCPRQPLPFGFKSTHQEGMLTTNIPNNDMPVVIRREENDDNIKFICIEFTHQLMNECLDIKLEDMLHLGFDNTKKINLMFRIFDKMFHYAWYDEFLNELIANEVEKEREIKIKILLCKYLKIHRMEIKRNWIRDIEAYTTKSLSI